MTAEEILRRVINETIGDPGTKKYEHHIHQDIALQAMEQYRNEGIREELIAFNKMMYRGQYDGIEPQIKACIDKYLKSKQ
jgi:hypothetical protein